MILTVGNLKGGVGKTTLALNVTIARANMGKDVLLVDGDEQHTALTFTELRTEQLGSPGYTSVSLHGAALRTQVRQLTPKYDDIIIDVGGRDTGSLRAALTVAHTLLIPVQPRSFDIWSVDQMTHLVKEAREINEHLRAVILLNAADALKDSDGLVLLPFTIGRRKAFPNAASSGKAVTEHTPKDTKAIRELHTLLKALYV